MLSVGDISAKRCWTAKTLVGSKKPLYKKLAVIMERNTGVISERNIAVILEENTVVIWDRNTVSNLESINYGNSEENTAT